MKATAAELKRLATICKAFPDVTAAPYGVHTTFRVRKKNFAMFMDHHHGVNWVALWCKAGPGVQGNLVDMDPERFFVPPYVGPSGWIGVRLDRRTDWKGVASLVRESYLLIAPKKLAALI